jgi:anti-sigma-K factor RskA
MTPTDPTVPPSRRVSAWWRALAYFLGLALLIGGAATWSMFEQFKAQVQHLQTKLQDLPQLRYLAVLVDGQQQPAMLASLDAKAGALQLQRLNAVREGREDSMQLWALAPGAAPRSLGLLESKQATLRVMAQEKDLVGVTELAISAENKGGADPARGPALPYLFKGTWIQKAI